MDIYMTQVTATCSGSPWLIYRALCQGTTSVVPQTSKLTRMGFSPC